MTLSRTFKISGLSSLLGLALAGIGAWLEPLGVLLIVVALPVFAVSATRHLFRGLLWRVGSRLFVSYLLIGVFPLPLLALLAYGGVWLLCGQLAGRRVEAALARRQAAMERSAARLVDRFEAASGAAARRAIFERSARTLPELSFAYQPGAGALERAGPLADAELLPRDWLGAERFSGIGLLGDRLFLATWEPGPGGGLLLVLSLGDGLRHQIEKETQVAFQFTRADFDEEEDNPSTPSQDREPSDGGVRFQLQGKEGRVAVVHGAGSEGGAASGGGDLELMKDSAAGPAGSGPIYGRWVFGVLFVQMPLTDWTAGSAAAPPQRLMLIVNSSIATEYRELFAHSKFGAEEEDIGEAVLRIMVGLGAFTAIVYLLASLLAGLLVLRIARATRRLTAGFGAINRGQFAHRAQLGGQDQLAGLVQDFNRMAAHLEASVEERAEKEALELQLQLARDLQRRLLPGADFSFPGVELATDFVPAAAIGGDFYHFVVEGEQRLVVVIADVSGHGLATGIVMAAAKASLAALASTGANTSAILQTLDQEILRTTDRRTFVTLGHTRFRFDAQRVEFTNAGHLYPYRIAADGAVSAVENPSRPLGVGLPASFTTVEAELARGDLWVFFSDGIIEASAADGEPFGFERFEGILAGSAGISAAELRDRILAGWRGFTGREDPEDDRTLIVFKIL